MEVNPCSTWEEMLQECLDLKKEPSGELAAHMEGCDSCRRTYREYLQMDALIREIPPEPVPEELSSDVMAKLGDSSVSSGEREGWILRIVRNIRDNGLSYAASILMLLAVVLSLRQMDTSRLYLAGTLALHQGESILSPVKESLQGTGMYVETTIKTAYEKTLFLAGTGIGTINRAAGQPGHTILLNGAAVIIFIILMVLNFLLMKGGLSSCATRNR